ncbi:MAG: phosphatidate cytidylyltransferase [Candidatus Nanopelagicales bacterium]|jgi:phosphatidate cytidylyltransferase
MTNETEQKPGRNVPAAIGVGLFLLFTVFFSLTYIKEFFFFVALVALNLGAYEFITTIKRQKNIQISNWVVSFSLAAILVASLGFGEIGLVGSLAVALALAFVVRLKDGSEGIFVDSSAVTFLLIYLGVFGGVTMLMLRQSNGAYLVATFILLTALSDTGGYLVGSLIGKHPILPKLSPKKSWQGLAGSILFAGLFGIFVVPLWFGISSEKGLLIGVALAIFGTIGDFFESAIKRDLGVKDFAKSLPGHGGMMDRLDSLAFNSIAAWILFGIFLGF